MRIIAGTAKGRPIIAPKGQLTRPTQDYVRESLFNIIQRDVPNATVLDLFAGSGALALESLSRGAASAVLVDSSRQAIECIRRNVHTLGFNQSTDILSLDWHKAIERLAAENHCFDVIFLDPPYKLIQYPEMMAALQQHNLLAQGALFVIEHQKNVDINVIPPFAIRSIRTYGDTAIHLVTFNTGG